MIYPGLKLSLFFCFTCQIEALTLELWLFYLPLSDTHTDLAEARESIDPYFLLSR